MSRYTVSVGYKRIGIGMMQSSRIGFGMGDIGYIGIGEISRLHELVRAHMHIGISVEL